MKKLSLLLSLLFLTSNFAFAQEEKAKPSLTYANTKTYEPYRPTYKSDGSTKKIKNVILLIGDGMGPVQAASGMYGNNDKLAMFYLKSIGYSRTQSASHFTTDSAAGGTALATGVRTTNGYVGVDKSGKPLTNMTETLAPLGYASGVITTDNISGATPSSFYAHQQKRGDTGEILAQLKNSKLAFFAGGSVAAFNKYAPAQVDSLKLAGFTIENDYRKLNEHSGAGRIAVFADEFLTPVKDGRDENLLAQTTAFALDYLSKQSKKGFFLMVEGAQIDWGGHNNDPEYVVTEAVDFDKAVSEALKFADKNGETLVIITADHETGGMTFNAYNHPATPNTATYTFSTAGHSAMMVPVFAYGPFSHLFAGVQNNTEIFEKIKQLLTK